MQLCVCLLLYILGWLDVCMRVVSVSHCVQAKSGRDETALMRTLHDYLTDNDAVIRNYFTEADVNKSGTLDHTEVAALVAQIPGLEKEEQ